MHAYVFNCILNFVFPSIYFVTFRAATGRKFDPKRGRRGLSR